MAVNYRTASSRQLAARWSTATGVLRSDSLIRRRLLHRRLRENESRFNLWDHNGRIRVRRYAGERCLPEYVIERHSSLTPGVMASLELSSSRIMHDHMLQRLFQTSVQPNTCNFFLGLLIRRMPRRIAALNAERAVCTKY
ncbi:transposable element Tcb1 transposase [Trichonephila clavipes]|nr:transposable element Tcb1 transposase [Trichonephila clavipes]